jgi:aspartate/methionine/tyrosine aminotransferase
MNEQLTREGIQVAGRLQGIEEYYFSQKLQEIDRLNRSGKNILNLGIGSPDLPPHPDVVRVLHEESIKSNVHGYQGYKGVPALRNAIAMWYQKEYKVSLNPDNEILPLIGSKEGILHICMTYLNKGDVVLIPNPGYPTYRSAVSLAGGDAVEYGLTEEKQWAPDFEALQQAADRYQPKLMFVNYPHMPTGQLPTKELFEQLVQFAKDHHILLVHDNPYSFILNDNPMSLLSVAGAKDHVLELNSLSKSHNMAGWRIGMLCGSARHITDVLRFKSNMDSGMFLPLQLAAAKALSLGRDWFEELNETYRQRRITVFKLLEHLDCRFSKSQAGMFVWAKIPEPYKTGFELSDHVLYNKNVFITPGGIFGSAGDAYVRVSLCSPVEKFEDALNRISA